MDHMDHDIHDFVRKAQGDLQAEYLRIRKRATEDPGTAGDQGEENWAALLREWLPDYFQVVTKGRILTDSGYASPQIDVLVLYPSYPKSSLLSGLFSELAWVFTDMRQLEEYFRKVNLAGSGQGRMRLWSIDIYSAKIRDRVYRGALSNGVPYDEWHVGF